MALSRPCRRSTEAKRSAIFLVCPSDVARKTGFAGRVNWVAIPPLLASLMPRFTRPFVAHNYVFVWTTLLRAEDLLAAGKFARQGPVSEPDSASWAHADSNRLVSTCSTLDGCGRGSTVLHPSADRAGISSASTLVADADG